MPTDTDNLDPAEAAAREIADKALSRHGMFDARIAAAIIRKHMQDHLSKLHGTAMNLPTPKEEPGEATGDCCAMAYKYGHRDARRAAAEAIITSLHGD